MVNKTKTKTKKKNTRNRENQLVSGSVFPLYGALPFFPPSFRASLPYHAYFNTSSVGLNSQLFNSNNLYDPDYTGTGHQCRGWDQLTPYYKYYRVISVTMSVHAFWDMNVSGAFYIGHFVDADTTVSTTAYSDMIERFGPKRVKVLKPSVFSEVRLPQLTVNLTKLANKALAVQRTAVGSAPDLAGPRLGLWWGQADGSTPTASPRILVDLVYTFDLFEPTEIGGS